MASEFAQNLKSNHLLYSLYYVEACNALKGPNSAPLLLQATQLLLKKCRCGGEPLSTLCLIFPARDSNLRLPL